MATPRLTLSKAKFVMDNINAKIRGDCPMCGGSDRSLDDNIVVCLPLASNRPDSIYVQTTGSFTIKPLAQLTCNNCAFVAHFAVRQLGVDPAE
ncbi:MAG: hypothetical protein ABIK09_05830 [Pseudomonadota bacterium]